MKVIGARCLVRESKLEKTLSSGIVIPGRDKEQTNIGTVISVGEGAILDNGTKVPMQVSEGDQVIYASFSGSPINIKGEVFIILNERDILCTIDENDK